MHESSTRNEIFEMYMGYRPTGRCAGEDCLDGYMSGQLDQALKICPAGVGDVATLLQ